MDSLNSVKASVQQSQAKGASPASPAPQPAPGPPSQRKGKAASPPPVSAQPASPPEKTPEQLRKERGAALSSLAKQQKAQYDATLEARATNSRAQESIKQAEARAQAAEELVEKAKKDPMGFLETHGIKMRQIAERVAKGEPVTDASKEALERAIKAEEDLDKLRQEWTDREAKATAAKAFEQAKADLSKTFDEKKAELPYFAKMVKKYGQDMLVTEVQGMYRKIQANPATSAYAEQYSFSEVLEAIEAEKADLAAALRDEAAEGETPAAGGAGLPPKPSLTNGGSSGVSVMPADYKKLTPKQQREADRAAYRALKKK